MTYGIRGLLLGAVLHHLSSSQNRKRRNAQDRSQNSVRCFAEMPMLLTMPIPNLFAIAIAQHATYGAVRRTCSAGACKSSAVA
jgi:hypothetical protein